MIADNDHSHVAGVHDAVRGHVIELGVLFRESFDVSDDISDSGLRHLFGRIAGLGNAARNRSLSRWLDMNRDTRCVQVGKLWMLIGIVHL